MSEQKYNKLQNLFRVFGLSANLQSNDGKNVDIQVQSLGLMCSGGEVLSNSKKALEELDRQGFFEEFNFPEYVGTVRLEENVYIAKGVVANGVGPGRNDISYSFAKELANSIDSKVDFDFSV